VGRLLADRLPKSSEYKYLTSLFNLEKIKQTYHFTTGEPMPMRKTPSGDLIKTGGTKRFNEIQTENAAALKSKLVDTVTCGVEAKIAPKVLTSSPVPTPIPKLTSLEKVTNG
jgi:hypothetical protein